MNVWKSWNPEENVHERQNILITKGAHSATESVINLSFTKLNELEATENSMFLQGIHPEPHNCYKCFVSNKAEAFFAEDPFNSYLLQYFNKCLMGPI